MRLCCIWAHTGNKRDSLRLWHASAPRILQHGGKAQRCEQCLAGADWLFILFFPKPDRKRTHWSTQASSSQRRNDSFVAWCSAGGHYAHANKQRGSLDGFCYWALQSSGINQASVFFNHSDCEANCSGLAVWEGHSSFLPPFAASSSLLCFYWPLFEKYTWSRSDAHGLWELWMLELEPLQLRDFLVSADRRRWNIFNLNKLLNYTRKFNKFSVPTWVLVMLQAVKMSVCLLCLFARLLEMATQEIKWGYSQK